MSRAKGVFDQAWLSGADVVRLATRLRQLIEQHLRFFEIRRVEAFGEPAVDRREKVAGFGAPALLAPQPREARRDAQFQRFRPLLLRRIDCAKHASLSAKLRRDTNAIPLSR